MAGGGSAVNTLLAVVSQSSEEANHQADLQLMLRVRDGDEAGFAEVLDRYWASLVKYAAGMVRDVDCAEDLVQEAFVRLWRNRSSWVASGTLRGYLYRIVRNLALQEAEKRAVRQRFSWRERLAATFAQPVDPVEELERDRLRLSLERALASLAPRRREILILARFHDLTHAQIAEVMGISTQTVANQMSSALRDLRMLLGSRRD